MSTHGLGCAEGGVILDFGSSSIRSLCENQNLRNSLVFGDQSNLGSGVKSMPSRDDSYSSFESSSVYPSFNAHSLGASSMFSHKSCTSSGFKPFSSGDDSYTSYFCKAGSVTTPGESSSAGLRRRNEPTHPPSPIGSFSTVLRFSFGKDNTGDLSTIAVFLSIAVQDFGILFSGIDRRKRKSSKSYARSSKSRITGHQLLPYTATSADMGSNTTRNEGSLCPTEGNPPRFLQLYIYDTQNEVANRMRHFGECEKGCLDPHIVQGLIACLDEHNELVRLFRTARDRCDGNSIPDFKVRLYSVVGTREYDLPTSQALGPIVFDSGQDTVTDYDVVIHSKGGRPQRINKLHPTYMSLQFPLLFIYGTPTPESVSPLIPGTPALATPAQIPVLPSPPTVVKPITTVPSQQLIGTSTPSKAETTLSPPKISIAETDTESEEIQEPHAVTAGPYKGC
ncbi:hypothetical protein Tco_1353803 [Tanacetum coccineum]